MSHLLIVLPTRERPEQATEAVAKILSCLGNHMEVTILVNADLGDTSMENWGYDDYRVKVLYGERVSKIEAINRNVDRFEWDVVLVLADDMLPVVQEFGVTILRHMEALFPDTDGCLWFSDGRQSKFCTVPVMGRKYWYEHGKRIYHDSYWSYCCDVEQTELAMQEGKMCKVEGPMFMHLHSMFAGRGKDVRKPDDLLKHNQTFKKRDRDNLAVRRKLGFPQ